MLKWAAPPELWKIWKVQVFVVIAGCRNPHVHTQSKLFSSQIGDFLKMKTERCYPVVVGGDVLNSGGFYSRILSIGYKFSQLKSVISSSLSLSLEGQNSCYSWSFY